MPESDNLPNLAALRAQHEEICKEIDKLITRRDQIAGVMNAIRAYSTGAKTIGTFPVIRQYFDEHESGSAREIFKYAEAQGWNTVANNRMGALQTSLGHLVLRRELRRERIDHVTVYYRA